MAIYYKSPIGTIIIRGSELGISSLVFSDENVVEMPSQLSDIPEDEVNKNFEMASQWIKQLDEYFQTQRKEFTLPLDLYGTEFQKKVWNELLNIPFGKRMTYKELALRLGNIKAIRAVAAANGTNPVSIIVPCHRVIGSDGSLTGYGGGLWRKQWLLDFESREMRLF